MLPASLVLSDVFSLAAEPDRLEWHPFRPGIEIHRLYQTDAGGPAAALLRYAPGATVPAHDHSGYEHIIVLSGSQQDERGVYPTGTVVINPPGSGHTVLSEAGCIVLIIWEKPVVMRSTS